MIFVSLQKSGPASHNSSSGAEEASGTEGGRPLGVPGQTLRAEEPCGAHHDAQHGFLARGLITAEVSLQARRTLRGAFILHARKCEGRSREVKFIDKYGGGTERNEDWELGSNVLLPASLAGI